MKYCLDCYTPNATNAVRCINCNGLFFSDAVNETNNTAASSQVVCNGCKRFISRHGLVCQFCGCSVQTSVQDEMIERKLKLCHKSGYEIILSTGDVVGAASKGCELLKNDVYVSDSHIEIRQAGRFFELKDISGFNSFFVNDICVEVHGKYIIDNYDVIKIGLTDFQAVII